MTALEQNLNEQSSRTNKSKNSFGKYRSLDELAGLPRMDRGSPKKPGRVLKKLDSTMHAKMLRQRLQALMESGLIPASRLQESSAEDSPLESAAQEPTSTSPLPMQPIKNSETSLVAALIAARMIDPPLHRPSPIPMEVPRINPNYPTEIPTASTSNSTSTASDPNHIPLFDPTSLSMVATRGMKSVVSSNELPNGYVSLVDVGIKPPSYPFLDNMMETVNRSRWGTEMKIWENPLRNQRSCLRQ